MKAPDHRRSGVHRLAPRRAAPRRRVGGLRARRPLDRRGRRTSCSSATRGLPSRRRLVLSQSVVSELVHRCDVVYHLAAAVGVRLIVEQPVPTRWSRTSRAPRTCSSTATRFEQAGAHRVELRGLRRPSARSVLLEEDAPRIYGPTTAKRLGVRGLEGDGRVPGPRLPPGARARLRDRAASSTRSGRGRTASTGMVIPRFVAAGAVRRAARDARRREADALASATSRTRPRSSRPDGRARARVRSSTSARPSGSRILELAERVLDGDGLRARSSRSFRYEEVYGRGDRGRCSTGSRRSRRSAAAIGWRPSLDLERILADVIESVRLSRAALGESV